MKKFIKYFCLCLAFLIVPFIFAGCFGGLSGGGNSGGSNGKTALSRVNVSIDDPSYSRFADGNAKTPIVKISLNGQVFATLNQSNEDFIITYSNNVNPGTATVKITATKENKTFTGTKTWNFTIYAPTGEVGDFDAFRSALASTSINKVKLVGNITIPSGATVTIRNGVTVSLNGYRLSNRGKIVNNGTISANRVSGKISQLVTPGDIDNANSSSQILISSGQEMYIGGKIENHSRSALHFESGSNIYANEEISSSEISGSGYSFNLRIDIKSLRIEMKKTVEYDKDKQNHNPDIWLYNGTEHIGAIEYNEYYENNKNVGTATVTIEAVYASKKIFGSRTETFEIVPTSVKANNSSEIQALLDSENYGQVNFSGTNISNEIVVPENKILMLKNVCTINANMKIYGKVVLEGDLVANAVVETFENGKIESNKECSVFVAGDKKVCANICCKKVYLNETNNNCTFSGTAEVVRRVQVQKENLTVQNPQYQEGFQGSLTPSLFYANDNSIAVGFDSQVVNSDGTAYVGDVINAGTYYYMVSATNRNKRYYGSLILTYQVEPISVTVTAGKFPSFYIESNNYNNVVLETDASISSDTSILIPSWKTLVVSTNCTFSFCGDMNLYGKIVNKGVVYAKWDNNGELVGKINLKNDGKIENTGTMYLNAFDGEIDGGTVYNRKFIGECAKFYNKNGEETNLEQDSFVYGSDLDGLHVKCFINGKEFQEKNEFEAMFYSINAGGRSVLDVDAYYNSKHFYGVYKKEVIVLRGSGEVDYFSDLLDGLRLNSEGNCNYEKLALTADITLSEDITIPSGVTIDTAGFNIVTYNKEESKRYFITNNGTILIDLSTNSDCSFKNEYSQKSTGTVQAVATTVSELQAYTNIGIANCNFVLKIGASLTLSNNNYFTIADNVKNFTIDLCGNSLNFIYFWTAKNNITIMSSVAGATIETGSILDFASQGSIYIRNLENGATVTIKTENISYSGCVIRANNGGTIKEQ